MHHNPSAQQLILGCQLFGEGEEGGGNIRKRRRKLEAPERWNSSMLRHMCERGKEEIFQHGFRVRRRRGERTAPMFAWYSMEGKGNAGVVSKVKPVP